MEVDGLCYGCCYGWGWKGIKVENVNDIDSELKMKLMDRYFYLLQIL